MIAAEAFKVYTVASYRHLHAVRLIQARMRRLHGLAVLDWTHEALLWVLPLLTAAGCCAWGATV